MYRAILWAAPEEAACLCGDWPRSLNSPGFSGLLQGLKETEDALVSKEAVPYATERKFQ